jgi:hypothetical protein
MFAANGIRDDIRLVPFCRYSMNSIHVFFYERPVLTVALDGSVDPF